MILVDANLWIFALDPRLPEHAPSKVWLQRVVGEGNCMVPAAVQMEVMQYVTRSCERPDALLAEFLAQPVFHVPLDHATLQEAAPILLKEHPAIGARDASILVHARRHAAILASHDTRLLRAGKRLGIQVTDPISRSLRSTR